MATDKTKHQGHEIKILWRCGQISKRLLNPYSAQLPTPPPTDGHLLLISHRVYPDIGSIQEAQMINSWIDSECHGKVQKRTLFNKENATLWAEERNAFQIWQKKKIKNQYKCPLWLWGFNRRLCSWPSICPSGVVFQNKSAGTTNFGTLKFQTQIQIMLLFRVTIGTFFFLFYYTTHAQS